MRKIPLVIRDSNYTIKFETMSRKPCESWSFIKSPSMRSGCVYFHIGEYGQILYIGMSKLCNVKHRMQGHKCTAHWWDDIRSFRLIACADAAGFETAMIRKHRPSYNKIDHPHWDFTDNGRPFRTPDSFPTTGIPPEYEAA